MVLFFICCLSAVACKHSIREEQLARREQELLEKERKFALKEAEYRALLRMRDSLIASGTDTSGMIAWPPSVIGRWNSRVRCTASDCSEYVIGDQRSNIWEFPADSSGLVTKIVDNRTARVIRVLTGTFDNGAILLNFSAEPEASKDFQINAILNPVDSNLIQGTQIVRIGQNCTATFSVELSRLSTN